MIMFIGVYHDTCHALGAHLTFLPSWASYSGREGEMGRRRRRKRCVMVRGAGGMEWSRGGKKKRRRGLSMEG